METTYITANEAAKAWWKEILCKNVGNKFDMGDERNGGIAMLMAMINNSNAKRITENQIEEFNKALDKAIIQANGNLVLRSDYHPEGILEELINQANIPEDCVPWKTQMNITQNKVEVSLGYGKPYEVIFEKVV